jgi:hypothetical protein
MLVCSTRYLSKKFQKISNCFRKFKKVSESKLTRKVMAALLNLAFLTKLFLGPTMKGWAAVTRRFLQGILQSGCFVGYEMPLPLRPAVLADLLTDLFAEPALGSITKNGRVIKGIQTIAGRLVSR